MILQSSAATLAIYFGSMDAEEYMRFAIWIRRSIPSESTILIDKNPREETLRWMEEAIKFWTKNKIVVNRVEQFKNTDYIISTNMLNLTQVAKIEAKEGIFDPRSEVIYLYKITPS
jgi:sulfatase maturation enzyme AslB (radical SAM superfamily)